MRYYVKQHATSDRFIVFDGFTRKPVTVMGTEDDTLSERTACWLAEKLNLVFAQLFPDKVTCDTKP